MSPSAHVVVVGGGFAGLETAFYLRHRAAKRVEITLVSDRDEFLFKPNIIYVPFGRPPEDFRFPLREPCARKGIRFVHARAERVDPARKILVAGDQAIPYDKLVLATGAGMRATEVPGLPEHAVTIWTPEDMLRLRDAFDGLRSDGEGARKRILFLVPPNNKCSGPLYEMVLMLETWLRRHDARDRVDITYATYEKGFIQAFGPRLDEYVTGEFERRGIRGLKARPVVRIEDRIVHFADGTSEPFDLLVSFPPYIAGTVFDTLPHDERGFLRTNPATRQVYGHPAIYAVGDTGDFPVKQAFLALLQGDAAGEHIAAEALGEPPRFSFDPVSLCIMEQLDKATFAQVPLETTGDAQLPVRVREADLDRYKVGTGHTWRAGKKLIGAVLPYRFRHGEPFHAGATWKAMEAGLKVMAGVLAR